MLPLGNKKAGTGVAGVPLVDVVEERENGIIVHDLRAQERPRRGACRRTRRHTGVNHEGHVWDPRTDSPQMYGSRRRVKADSVNPDGAAAVGHVWARQVTPACACACGSVKQLSGVVTSYIGGNAECPTKHQSYIGVILAGTRQSDRAHGGNGEYGASGCHLAGKMRRVTSQGKRFGTTQHT